MASVCRHALVLLLHLWTGGGHPTPTTGSQTGCQGVRVRVHGGRDKPLVTRLAKSFMNETGAIVEVTMRDHSMFAQSVEEQDADIADGHKWGYNWDTYIFTNVRWTSFASAGKFEDITEEVAASAQMEWQDVFTRAREAAAVLGERVYGVPLDGDVILLAHRKDIFMKNNIKVPSTWQEFIDAAKTLKEGGHTKYGVCLQDKLGDVTAELFWAYMAPWLQSQGTPTGIWFDPDTMEPKSDSEAFRQALTMLLKMYEYSQYAHVPHGTPSDPSASDFKSRYGQENRYGYMEVMSAWSRGECGMFINFPGPIKLLISDLLPVVIKSVANGIVVTNDPHDLDNNGFHQGNNKRVFVYTSGGSQLTRDGGVPVEDVSQFFARVESPNSVSLYDTFEDMEAGTNRVSLDMGSGVGARLKTFAFGNQVGISMVPGSKVVLGEDFKTAQPCTSVLCPFTDRGKQGGHLNPGINSVPFYAGGGMGIFMRSNLDKTVRDCSFKFMVFLSEFRNSLKLVASGEAMLDPFRKRHFPDFDNPGTAEFKEVSQLYYSYGWTPEQLEEYKEVTETVWGHQNGAFDIRINGYEDYVRTPDLIIQALLAGDMKEDEASSIVASRMRLATATHGLDFQRALYRSALGLAPFIPPIVDATSSGIPLWVLYAVIGVVGFILFLFFVYKAVQLWREKQRLAAEHEAEMERRIVDGRKAVTFLQFPMVLVDANNFLDLTRAELNSLHEGLRNNGKLLWLDVEEAVAAFKKKGKVILFFSYQWLSWEARTGPNDVQLKAMKDSIALVTDVKQTTVDNIYIWLDILSIPQCHPTIKDIAINTLYVYASFADVMVIIAPHSLHANTGERAGPESYKSRVWTRAEQVAYFCSNPTNPLYLKTEHSFQQVPSDWIDTVSCIFDGELTCCRLKHKGGMRCDRLSLMPTLLGLYFKVYNERKLGTDAAQTIWNHVSRHKESMFPRTFKFETERGTETRTLFGDLLERAQRQADRDLQSAQADGRELEDAIRHVRKCIPNHEVMTPTHFEAPDAPANELVRKSLTQSSGHLASLASLRSDRRNSEPLCEETDEPPSDDASPSPSTFQDASPGGSQWAVRSAASPGSSPVFRRETL